MNPDDDTQPLQIPEDAAISLGDDPVNPFNGMTVTYWRRDDDQ